MTTRRGRGEGGIYERKNGRLDGTVDLGIRDGKRVRRTVYGRTRREVITKMQAVRAGGAGAMAPRAMTVARFLTAWLEDTKDEVRPSTIVGYSQVVDRHLIPALGATGRRV